MGVNIKFGDQILNNVSQLKVADADSIGTFDTFVYGTGVSLQSLKTVVTSESDLLLIYPDAGYDAMNQVQVNVSVNKPTLYTPVLSVDPDESTVLLIDDSNNGQFVNAFEVYKDNALLTTTSQRQLFMSALISTAGTYNIKVKALANGFNNSEYSNVISVTII